MLHQLKVVCKHLLFVFVIFIFCFVISPLTARNFNSFETQADTEKTKTDIIKLLDKIDPNGYYELDNTKGGKYGWQSRWLSPFNYRIYIDEISMKKPKPILTVEGNAADVITFSRIFTYEKLAMHEADTELNFEAIEPKSHLIGQSLNLVNPMFGIFYASYNSPSLTTGQTVLRSVSYFFVDSLLIWAAGRNWFREEFSISKNGGQVAAVMLITRGFGAFQNQALIRGHNRNAGLSYTFPLELY